MAEANNARVASNLIRFGVDMNVVYFEAVRIYNQYWHTDAHAVVEGLTNLTDLVPGTTLTKKEMLDSVNFATQIKLFMEGQAVTAANWGMTSDVLESHQP